MRITVINFLVIFVFCTWRILALPDLIPIGGIFDPYDQRQELAFQYAAARVNGDRSILTRSKLVPQIERLPADDSFHASKRVCLLLRSGVAAIFGPQSENTANHVQSICDAMEVPHIETRWDFKHTRDAYSLNLYPHPSSLGQAYRDILKKLEWKRFVILYDSSESLVRVQALLKEKSFTVSVRQLTGEDWRPLLKELKKTQETKFVVDVAEEKIANVLKQASQIGLMREYHSYFLTSLNLHLVDLEDYRYGGTNITSIQLLDPHKREALQVIEEWKYGELKFGRTIDPSITRITVEAALMYDAVHLFAVALDELDHRSRDVDITPLYCEGDKTWQHGNSLINYMKWYSSRRPTDNGANSQYFSPDAHQLPPAHGMINSGYPGMSSMTGHSYMAPGVGMGGMPGVNLMPRGGIGSIANASQMFYQTQVMGLTGLIKFDTNGFRTDFELDLLELDSEVGLKKVGVWSKASGANYTRTHVEISDAIEKGLKNRTLIVTTALTDPYTMLKESSEELTGNDKYEGFCVDIIHNISHRLGFNYTFKEVEDGAYGSKNSETGEWNGMVRELLDHKADLAIVDFTITYEREKAVDFSMPFMDLGISIIYKKPQKKAPSLFSFMSPFSIDVWIYMATAYLGVSVLLFILARMTPEEWTNPLPCIEDPEELENCFTLVNSLWFMIATFLCQGADIAPRAVSTRIVAGIWWFFTLIMISSYTANLAAFLTVERMESPIEGAEDLAKQTKIKYGCKKGGSTYGFFQDSKISTFEKMWNAMYSTRPSVFTDKNSDGIERVQKANGMYAFLMESSSIEYEVERRCDLMQVGGLLDSKSYGIALPPGSPYTGAISQAVLKMKEDGILHALKTRWWKNRKGGGKCATEAKSDSAGAAELGLDNVGGVFVVMAGGLGLACVTACCEFTWKARKLATEQGDTFCDELMKEFRFIANCSENVKPVRKRASPPGTDTSTVYFSTDYGYSNSLRK